MKNDELEKSKLENACDVGTIPNMELFLRNGKILIDQFNELINKCNIPNPKETLLFTFLDGKFTVVIHYDADLLMAAK